MATVAVIIGLIVIVVCLVIMLTNNSDQETLEKLTKKYGRKKK